MKLNRKGFMMAEVVVVSAIVLLFLATVYTSYNKLYSRYKTRLSYYDTVSLYELAYYRDILVENKTLISELERAKPNGYSVYSGTKPNETVFFVDVSKLSDDTNTDDLISSLSSNLNINPTFKDYIKYLSNAIKPDSKYLMLMESCNTKVTNNDDCKYSYLEIYDETGTPSPIPSGSGSTIQEGDCPGGYKVTYDANGGTGDSMGYSCATYGKEFVTKANEFTKTNYKFIGWNEAKNGTGVSWKLTSAGVHESGKPWVWTYKKDITLYAQWEWNGKVCCAYPADSNGCAFNGDKVDGLCYITFNYGVCDNNIGGIYKVHNGAC